MESFAEKPIDNLASTSFCTELEMNRRKYLAPDASCSSVQFVTVEKLQKSPTDHLCIALLYAEIKKKVTSLLLRSIVQESNSEKCLDLIFVAFPCEKFIIVVDTDYITSEIRKFMLGMQSPGSFQNIGFLIRAQQGSDHVNHMIQIW